MKKYIIALLFLLIPSFCYSANWYVNKAGNNTTGQSWKNAWNEMDQIVWASVGATDTIYIAGGTYTTRMTINKSGTDTDNRIKIYRVTSTDAVAGDADWSASYDSQVIINDGSVVKNHKAINLNAQSNITIDGRVTNGIYIYHGIGEFGVYSEVTPVSNVTFRYLEIEGPGSIDYGGETGTRGILLKATSGMGANVLIEYCYIHDQIDCIYTLLHSTVTVQHCTLHGAIDLHTPTDHANIWYIGPSSDNIVFRYNIVSADGSEGMFWGGTGSCDGALVYNNIFNNMANHTLQPRDSVTLTNLKIYNNTFANSKCLPYLTLTGQTAEYKNNVAYKCTVDISSVAGSTLTASNNVKTDSDPGFVNASTYNFSLQSSASTLIDQGTDLSATFTDDYAGTPRGATFDIGAYEYVATPLTTTATFTLGTGGGFYPRIGGTAGGGLIIQ